MEILFALSIGLLAACGIYLVLRERTFSVIMGLSLIGYAVNLFLFASGRLQSAAPPIVRPEASFADPLPQALILTAIVIGFGMTAYLAMLALRALSESSEDRIDLGVSSPPSLGADARRDDE